MSPIWTPKNAIYTMVLLKFYLALTGVFRSYVIEQKADAFRNFCQVSTIVPLRRQLEPMLLNFRTTIYMMFLSESAEQILPLLDHT
jgi:hypothetical protein